MSDRLPDGKTWFLYETDPIDIAWPEPLAMFYDPMSRRSSDEPDNTYFIMMDLVSACVAAKSNTHWEGDFSWGPCIFWLPNPGGSEFMHAFAWKQNNNGTTYIASPVNLPWLGECDATYQRMGFK